jgi:type IV pilus assembly protein PilC
MSMKKKRLTNMYLSMLCTEFSMLIQGGITAGDGVMMMIDDESDKNGKVVLQTLLASLEKGEPLSTAFHESGYFPAYMVNMAKVGEKTGRLPETLSSLSIHYDRQERLSAAIKNATLYPAILLAMMVAVVLILIVQVLPIFNDVFGRLGSQMSPLAARLMQFGGWLKGFSSVIALIFGILFLIGFLAWIIPEIREGIASAFKNRMGKRGIFGKIASAHFISGITLAMASGLDLEEAMDMAVLISGDSKAVAEQREKCAGLLRSGSSLADAMRDSGIISVRDSRVLTMGTRSGMADSVMTEIANRSERTVQDDIGRIVSRIEPTLVVITSVIVGIILLSVMLPLMSIMTAIG